jgi:hypothetical protein
LLYEGTCNELNASYAADVYARLNGIGALDRAAAPSTWLHPDEHQIQRPHRHKPVTLPAHRPSWPAFSQVSERLHPIVVPCWYEYTNRSAAAR